MQRSVCFCGVCACLCPEIARACTFGLPVAVLARRRRRSWCCSELRRCEIGLCYLKFASLGALGPSYDQSSSSSSSSSKSPLARRYQSSSRRSQRSLSPQLPMPMFRRSDGICPRMRTFRAERHLLETFSANPFAQPPWRRFRTRLPVPVEPKQKRERQRPRKSIIDALQKHQQQRQMGTLRSNDLDEQ